MFDLAIMTTLESKTLAAYPPCACRRFPLAPGIGVCDFLLVSGRIVSRRNQVLIFLREFTVLRNLRDSETKVFVSQLDDSIVKLWISI
ncbi:hypothetical protein GQ457_08G031590 [Hibiscus cannabinus]